MMQILMFAIFAAIAITILWRPYLGVVIAISSVSAVDLVWNFPLATSVISALGAITFLAYVLHELPSSTQIIMGWSKGHAASLLLIFWMLVTNPEAALGAGNRIWFWTFVQLCLFAWLTGKLLRNPKQHRVLIWCYSAIATISAVYVIQQGSIGESLNETVRGTGLAGGPNNAARYIVVALIFLNYLRSSVKTTIQRWVLVCAMGCSVLGVIYTVSRTGMLLVVAVIAMIIFDRTQSKQRKSLGLLCVGALVFVFFIPDGVWKIFQSVAPSIEKGTDTVGLRYKLWEAGFAMWRDHPITGVGIGQFSDQLHSYGLQRSLGAHNMYIQMLAETGIIGLALFLIVLGTSLWSLWRATCYPDKDLALLAKTWLMVFVVLLLGGLTKHDQADKLLWCCIGVSFSLEVRMRHLVRRTRWQPSRRGLLTTKAMRPQGTFTTVRRNA